VVGTRGHGSLGSVLGGSVSARIVAHTTGPVAVIPLDWEAEESDTAVVAVDGSENAAKAAEWAGRHLSYLKAVTVLSAWEVPALAIPPDPTIYEQLGDDARMLAEEHTRSAAKSLAVWRSEESITEVVEHGFAREVVRRWAHGAQVLVVGARGHRDLLHGLLGSVTSSVIHRPPCPIIVVPHE
jgi:nucleotide-binding universal stress UspA family protein